MSAEEQARQKTLRRLRKIVIFSYNFRSGMTRTEWLTAGIVAKAYSKEGNEDGFASEEEARHYLLDLYAQDLLERHPSFVDLYKPKKKILMEIGIDYPKQQQEDIKTPEYI